MAKVLVTLQTFKKVKFKRRESAGMFVLRCMWSLMNGGHLKTRSERTKLKYFTK